MLPTERIDRGDFDWSELREAFFEGFHRCLPALAAAGNSLVVEHIVETRAWMSRLLSLLAGYDVVRPPRRGGTDRAARCPTRGAIRRDWQHSLLPTREPRYSITLRTRAGR